MSNKTTTTKAGQRRKRYQLRHPFIHPKAIRRGEAPHYVVGIDDRRCIGCGREVEPPANPCQLCEDKPEGGRTR